MHTLLIGLVIMAAGAADAPVVPAPVVPAPVIADVGRLDVGHLDFGPGQVAGFTWAGGDTLAVLLTRADRGSLSGRTDLALVVGDTSGTVYWRSDFSGVLARGLAWDGEFLWSTGDDTEGGSLLYKIATDSMAIAEVYPTPGHRPRDLAYDGRWLWLTDRDTGRIDRIDPETGDPTRSVGAPGFSPTGLAWDGRAMWVADAGTGRLTRLRGGRLGSREEADAGGWFVRGRDVWLAHDGRSLWALLEGESELRRLDLLD